MSPCSRNGQLSCESIQAPQAILESVAAFSPAFSSPSCIASSTNALGYDRSTVHLGNDGPDGGPGGGPDCSRIPWGHDPRRIARLLASASPRLVSWKTRADVSGAPDAPDAPMEGLGLQAFAHREQCFEGAEGAEWAEGAEGTDGGPGGGTSERESQFEPSLGAQWYRMPRVASSKWERVVSKRTFAYALATATAATSVAPTILYRPRVPRHGHIVALGRARSTFFARLRILLPRTTPLAVCAVCAVWPPCETPRPPTAPAPQRPSVPATASPSVPSTRKPQNGPKPDNTGHVSQHFSARKSAQLPCSE